MNTKIMFKNIVLLKVLFISSLIFSTVNNFATGNKDIKEATKVNDDSHKYKNAKFPVDERVHDLLSRMTIEEKIAQMTGLYSQKSKWFDPKTGNFSIKLAKDFLKDGAGHIYGIGETKGGKESALIANAIQKYVVENTRLGIPVFFSDDILHGHKAKDATIFPIPIALASTWNDELVGEVYKTIALEAKSRGIHVGFGPNLDVARDPRWGGVGYTFGEDSYLVSKLGMAAIREIQGPGPQLRMAAFAMHYGANGASEGGNNMGFADISDRTFREVYLPPFKFAAKEAKVSGIIVANNEISGIPMHNHKVWVNDVLRKEFNYDGIITSDLNGIANLSDYHSITPDHYGAAKLAINTGIDLELPEGICYDHLIKMVKSKEIPETLINKAVGRILKAKFMMGLFENPYVDPENAGQTVGCQNNRYVALKAAQESLILLKNDNNTLPLVRRTLKSIAVIGPNANKVISGEHTEKSLNHVSVLDGIKSKVLKETTVNYAEGCKITKEGFGWKSDTAKLMGMDSINKKLIAEAVQTAEKSEVVLLVLGSNDQINRLSKSPNHLGDKADLDLPGVQNELVKAIISTGKPIIVYLTNSNPLTLNYIHNKVPAILEGWYAGQEKGTAVADIIFGDINPGGKLPISIPKNSNQLPSYYNYKPNARLGYSFESNGPLYPFGFGLSYTTFNYETPIINKPKIKSDGKVTLSVKVTNTGKVKGDEVVQLYIRDEQSSITRPIKELKGFKKVTLMPLESRTVDFELDAKDFGFYDSNMSFIVEKGKFTLMCGGNSVDLKTVQLEIE